MPGPKTVRRWRSYEPNHDWDLRVVEDAFRTSGGRTRYLGEWHSHLFGLVRPSGEDLETMRLVAAYEPAQLPHPLSAIVGRDIKGSFVWAMYRLSGHGLLRAAAMVTNDGACQ